VSGRLSPLIASLPLHDCRYTTSAPRSARFFLTPALLGASDFWPAPLRSRSALMLCSCVRMSVSICHKCCFTWYYYIDSCNIRYAPNRSQDLALKISNGGNTARPPPATYPEHGLARPLAAPGVGTHAFKSVPQIPNCHYTPGKYSRSRQCEYAMVKVRTYNSPRVLL